VSPTAGFTVTVRVFARAREVAGASTLEVALPRGARAEAVWHHLPPEVQREVPRDATRLAVNGRWVSAEWVVHDGDEVALVTPVSGGGT
jgi:molybdopterin converting factor small subunit